MVVDFFCVLRILKNRRCSIYVAYKMKYRGVRKACAQKNNDM